MCGRLRSDPSDLRAAEESGFRVLGFGVQGLGVQGLGFL